MLLCNAIIGTLHGRRAQLQQFGLILVGASFSHRAHRQAEHQFPRVVRGAMHALQPQAAVYTGMGLPEELPAAHSRT